jgi:hypothetical protein
MPKLLFRKALVVVALTTSAIPLFADPTSPEPDPGMMGASTTPQPTIIDQILTILQMG